MASTHPVLRFESARVQMTVSCPDCHGEEGSGLMQGAMNLPRENDVAVITCTPCGRCNPTGRMQLEVPLEQFRRLIAPPPASEDA